MFQDLKEIIELKPWLFHKLKPANVNAKQNTSLKIPVVFSNLFVLIVNSVS